MSIFDWADTITETGSGNRSPQAAAAEGESTAAGRETGETPQERTVRLALGFGEAKVRLRHARAVLERPHDGSCAAWISLDAECDCWQADLRLALDGELY